MQITIRFGASNEVTREYRSGTTVGALLRDTALQSVLGFGNNVQAVIDGAVQTNDSPLEDGDVLTVETKANSKA